jgi:hypothetical protein
LKEALPGELKKFLPGELKEALIGELSALGEAWLARESRRWF